MPARASWSHCHWASLSAGIRKNRWSGAIARGVDRRDRSRGTPFNKATHEPRIRSPDRDPTTDREVRSIFTASKYGPGLLVADRELNENALVSLRAAVFDIRQQPAALRHKAQQASPRRMIFFVCLKVFGQLSDTRAQNCDLHFRRPGVGLVGLVPGYDLPFCFSRQCHLKGCYSCSSLYSFCINASVTQSRGGGALFDFEDAVALCFKEVLLRPVR